MYTLYIMHTTCCISRVYNALYVDWDTYIHIYVYDEVIE